jgi:hypothetical protein
MIDNRSREPATFFQSGAKNGRPLCSERTHSARLDGFWIAAQYLKDAVEIEKKAA